MTNWIKRIDSLLCSYLGLEKEEVSPNTIEQVTNHFFVSHTESYRRHLYTEHWHEFINQNIDHINPENKEKLGISLGKMIAKNLTVSFEPIQIEKEKINA